MTTMAIAPLPVQTWDLGSKRSTALGTPVILVSHVANGVGESRYSALRVPGAVGGYVVPTGKTLRLTKCRSYATTAAAEWYTLYGDADAGVSQVAAPAAEVPIDAPAVGDHNTWGAPLLGSPLEADVLMELPADKYPAIRCMTASCHCSVWVLGELV